MIFPHGSDVCGNAFAKFTAGLLSRDGSIRLLTNGPLSVMARPTLQAAEAKDVKSPCSIAGVGINAVSTAGSWRSVVPWYPVKKNNLSFIIGPPIVPPNWLRL